MIQKLWLSKTEFLLLYNTRTSHERNTLAEIVQINVAGDQNYLVTDFTILSHCNVRERRRYKK